ncbi:hypothetical protein [uncultured Halomonas sp.]|uniref:hypothetical protein n=1 Tax=uncultured Halomonas sp. TaxID=173971 RepID=UPI002639C61B|nr:hypothetical protein [uncultured Halomonas sp.]
MTVKMPEPVAYMNEDGYLMNFSTSQEIHSALITTDQAEAYAQAVRDEAEKPSRAKHYGNGYQDGWNSALDAAIDLIDTQFDGAENTAVLLARGAAGRIRALKRGESNGSS